MSLALDLAAVYRQRLNTLVAGTIMRIHGAWRAGFDPTNPIDALQALGATAGALTTATQTVALAEVQAWLQALISGVSGLPISSVPAPRVPALAGTSAQGVPLPAVTGQAVAVYLARLGQEAARELAAESARAWLTNVTVTETYRVANRATLDAAVGDERFTGRVTRITRAGSCDFCALIADRGYIPAHAGFAAHRACRCTASPEISSFATSRASTRRGIAAASESGGGGGTPPPAGGGGGGGPGPERGLLTDATAGWRRTDLPTEGLRTGRYAPPPAYAELVARGQVTSDWSAFNAKETATAGRLRDLAIDVVSIRDAGGRYGKSPDAAIVGRGMTVELKAASGRGGSVIFHAMDLAGPQSRRLVVDLSGGNIALDEAVRQLSMSLARRGGGFDEILVLGQGWGILWP